MTFSTLDIAIFFGGLIALVVAVAIGESGSAPTFRRRRK